MASYTVKNYSAYASSMAKPSSSSTSSRLDSKGYTPVSTTAKPTTAAAKTYQDKYAARDNYESPSSSKSKPSAGLGAPTKKPAAVAAPTVEDRFANAWTLSGGSDYDNPMSKPPSAIGVYETPKAQELTNYMTSAGIQDALYEAQGLINQSSTPQMQMSVRPMNADEIKKFVPVQNLNNSGITVEQLSSMDAPMQKATLESLGITNAQWVSSQGPRPMSLQEFDQATMASVHYGQPLTRDPENAMYNTIQQPTQQGLGYTDTDVAPTMPSAEQVAIMPDAPGMMTPATLGEVPSVDTLSNQMLDKPEVPAPSSGLMSRKPLTKEQSEALTNVDEIIKAQNSSIYKGKTFSQELLNKAVDQSIKVPTKRAMLKGIMTVEVAGRGPITEQGYSRKNIKDLGPNSAWRARLVRDGVLTSDNKVTSEYSPENVFNSVYANRNGNGDYASGDGNRFKGRGLVQITGRSNYTAVQNKLREQGIDIDLISKPELVNEPEYALPAAIALVEHLGLTDETSQNMSARGLSFINPKAPATTANARWDAAIEALREYDPAAADAMENRNEYKAQETVGTTVDGIIGNNSIREMQNWLRTNNIAIPNNATGMDLVVLVNENS